MPNSHHERSLGDVCDAPPLPAPHSKTYPSTSEYVILMNRFKLLDLAQRVAHRDVMEMVSTIGLEALASRCTMQRWMKAGELGLTESTADHASRTTVSRPTLHSPKECDEDAYRRSSSALHHTHSPQQLHAVSGNDAQRSHMSQPSFTGIPPQHRPSRPAVRQEESVQEAVPRTKYAPRYRTQAEREWFFSKLAQPRHRLRMANDNDAEYDESRCAPYAVRQQQKQKQHTEQKPWSAEEQHYSSSHARATTRTGSDSAHTRHETDEKDRNDHSHSHDTRSAHRPRAHWRDHGHTHSPHPHHRHSGVSKSRARNSNRDTHRRGHDNSISRSASAEVGDRETSVSMDEDRGGSGQTTRGQPRHSHRHRHHRDNWDDERMSGKAGNTQSMLDDHHPGTSSDCKKRVNENDSANTRHYQRDYDQKKDSGPRGGVAARSERSSSGGGDDGGNMGSTAGANKARDRSRKETSFGGRSNEVGASQPHSHEAAATASASGSALAQVTEEAGNASPTAVDKVVGDGAEMSHLSGRADLLSLGVSQMAGSVGGASMPYNSQAPSQFNTINMSSGVGNLSGNYGSNFSSSQNPLGNTDNYRDSDRSRHGHQTTSSAMTGTTPSTHGTTSAGSLGGSGVARVATPTSRGTFAPKAKPKGAVDTPRVPMQAIQHAAALISRQRQEQQLQQLRQDQQQKVLQSSSSPLTPHTDGDSQADARLTRLAAVLPCSHSLSGNTPPASPTTAMATATPATPADTARSLTSLPAPLPQQSHPLTASRLSEADESTLRTISHTIDDLLSSHRRILGSVAHGVCLDSNEDTADASAKSSIGSRRKNDSNSAHKDQSNSGASRGRGSRATTVTTAAVSALTLGKSARPGESNPNATVVTVEMNNSSSGEDESDGDDEAAHFDIDDDGDGGRSNALLLAQMRRRVTAMHAEVAQISRDDTETRGGCEDKENAVPEVRETAARLDAVSTGAADKLPMQQSAKGNVCITRDSNPICKAPVRRRLRGSLPAAICDRLRSYQLSSFENIAYHEKQWNNSTVSQFVFAQRLTNSLFEDCFDDVMAEVESIMDTYVDGLAEHELQ